MKQRHVSNRHLFVVLLVVLAGCTAAQPDEGADERTSPCVTGVGLTSTTMWEPDSITMGYSTPGNEISGFFVVTENETVHGVDYISHNTFFNNDAYIIQLSTNLTGEHRLRVVYYNDSDGDAQFDPDVDKPCRDDGNIIATGNITHNFTETEDRTAG